MKTIFRLKNLGLLALFATLGISCSDDDNGESTPDENLIEMAQTRAELSTFVQAVELANLTSTFTASSDFTFFAPTNAAFDDFLLENGFASINAVPAATLRELVLNHVISGGIETSEMLPGYRKTLAKGAASTTNTLSLYVDMVSGIHLNGVSSIMTPNIEASNGIIHIVDGVIGLPTIMDHIRANEQLSTLENALGTNPASGFIETLSGQDGAPFTVFAPLNSAFTIFLDEMDFSGIPAIPEDDLATVLQYHVSGGSNILSSTFVNNQTVSTAASQNLTITLTGGGKKVTDVNARIGNITTTDIQTVNGVIHLIDKVMLPNL